MSKRAIDVLRSAACVLSDGQPAGHADLVQKAAKMHDACPHCSGGGGAHCLYPEQPCPECGFTFADSYGIEEVERAD